MTLDNIDKASVKLRRATTNDIPNLETLLNTCYRNDSGWTNESALIGGIRTTQAELQKMLANDNFYLFVFQNPNKADEILGCISVDFTPHNDKPQAYIGTFAVSPTLQGRGIGDVMLNAVETFVSRHATSKNLTHFSMSILSHRPELLSYYQRRGYQQTGEKIPFPNDGNNGTPKRDDLFLEYLQKPIPNL